MTAFLDEHAAQVRQAADRIHGHVRRTPCLTTDLSQDLRLKPECFQVTGSFKVRGAFNAILTLAGREPRPAGVIAVSSGNHAQAVALAAATVGLPALVLIPEDANPAKVAATRALGAEVIQEGITFANREERLHEEMAARGFTLVHPFNDWNVIHGQGTAARELLEDAPDIEVIATPVGGGGILSGTAHLREASQSLDSCDRRRARRGRRRLSKLENWKHPVPCFCAGNHGRRRADNLDRGAHVRDHVRQPAGGRDRDCV